MDIKDYAQMMGYLTRPRDVVPDPRPMAQGGRIPFAKAKLVKEKYLQTELTKEQKNNIKTWDKNTGQKFSYISQTSENATKRNAIKNGRITGKKRNSICL